MSDPHGNMSEPSQPQPGRSGAGAATVAPAPGDVPAQPDPLARLYHMSTTAGVGTQDYVAINPTAIVALLLGFASVLVIFSNVLLIVPLVGGICAIVALVQIRRSNQTQTGTWLALLGLLLSLILGGGWALSDVIAASRHKADEQQIAKLLHHMGQDLAAGRYEQAYKLFDDRFHERVPLATFETAFAGFAKVSSMGELESVEWNNGRIEFEDRGDPPVHLAVTMGLFKFKANPQPSRITVQLENPGDGWRIEDIPNLFPSKKGQ